MFKKSVKLLFLKNRVRIPIFFLFLFLTSVIYQYTMSDQLIRQILPVGTNRISQADVDAFREQPGKSRYFYPAKENYSDLFMNSGSDDRDNAYSGRFYGEKPRTTTDRINPYGDSGMTFLVFILGVFAAGTAMMLTSIEKMSHYAMFLNSSPIRREILFLAKGVFGTIVLLAGNLIVMGAGTAMLRFSQLGPYINYGAHFYFFLTAFLQSLAVFYLMMFIGSFVGNVLSHIGSAILVFGGSLTFGVVIPWFLYLLSITTIDISDIMSTIFRNDTVPFLAMGVTLPIGSALIVLTYSLILFIAGIFITAKEKTWMTGRFFTNGAAYWIFYILASQLFATLFGTVGSLIGFGSPVIGFISLLLGYALGLVAFRFLFRLKIGA